MLLMQVVLAVDASRSMAENGCGVFALEATTLLARALSRLEVHCFVLLMFSLSLHEACRHCSFSGLVVLPRDAVVCIAWWLPRTTPVEAGKVCCRAQIDRKCERHDWSVRRGAFVSANSSDAFYVICTQYDSSVNLVAQHCMLK